VNHTNNPEHAPAFSWLGDTEPHLDSPAVVTSGNAVIGMYGGRTEVGANKNEDAAFFMSDPDGEWEFAMIADAHYSAESAAMLLELVNDEASYVREIMDKQPLEQLFPTLENRFVDVFSSPEALSRALDMEGEASCIICARSDRFLWWMSIGDCQVFLFHRELAKRGQFALNQRNAFEWIGYRNTFTNVVPCYSSGVRGLLSGRSVICLATDGVFEGDEAPLIPAHHLYQAYMAVDETIDSGLESRTCAVLNRVHQLKGRDSATLIAWNVGDPAEGGGAR
jgi:hypothetical protein